MGEMNLQDAFRDPHEVEGVRLLEAGWPMVVRFHYQHTHFGGGKHTISFGPFKNEDERQRCWDKAIEMGWTPPKWWQFWRWDDYPRKRPASASDAPKQEA